MLKFCFRNNQNSSSGKAKKSSSGRWVVGMVAAILLFFLGVYLGNQGKPSPRPAEVSPVKSSPRPAEVSPVNPSPRPAEVSPVNPSPRPAEVSPVNPSPRPAEVVPVNQPPLPAEDNTFTGVIPFPGNVKLEMIRVEHGSFTMSQADRENDCDERPHEVTLTKDFYLGKTEVTQAQWEAVMGNNPSDLKKGADYPVENVSWHEAMEFCRKLNEGDYAPEGWKFTLPTETQWEYACRGGNKSKGYKYSGSDNVNEVAWHSGNSEGTTRPVGDGQLHPNELGFYDMSGNVWEWCLDDHKSDSNQAVPEFLRGEDRSGWDRVCRGGSWHDDACSCRAANRGFTFSDRRFNSLGFRLALVPVQ